MGTHDSNRPAPTRRVPKSTTLRDGQEIRFRHVTNGDRAELLEFLGRLSLASRRYRFFSVACDLRQAAQWAASADGTDHIGIAALDPAGRIIGHAASCRIYGPRAEVAVEIDETHRHLGLGTILLARLAREAERTGVRTFVAEVLPENREMLAVFRDGFDAQQQTVPGEIDIEFSTAAWRRLDTRLRTLSSTAPTPTIERPDQTTTAGYTRPPLRGCSSVG